MPAQPRLIFVNLPVTDLGATKAFFRLLDFSFDERFTDGRCACMVVSDRAYVMLLQRDRFEDFATRPVADGHLVTGSILCVSASSRDDVDAFVDVALVAGGSPAGEPIDHGFMYGRSFLDLDGHHWEVMWMSPEAEGCDPAEPAHASSAA